MYVTVASVVAVLLAMGGLLFYKYKSKVSPPGAPVPASVSPLVSGFPRVRWGLRAAPLQGRG